MTRLIIDRQHYMQGHFFSPLFSLLPGAPFLLYPCPAQAPPPTTAPPVNGAFVGASQHSKGKSCR